MSGASSGAPPGSGSPVRKKGAVALQVKLACATLDAVKTRYPELKDRRFVLRTKQPYAIDTMVRLETRLSGGAPCFHATAAVEKVTGGGAEPVSVTLAIIAMDEPGRELVTSMGGKSPRTLKDSGEVAPAAVAGAATIPDASIQIPTSSPEPEAESANDPPVDEPAANDDGAPAANDGDAAWPQSAPEAAPEENGINWDAAAPAYPVAETPPAEAAEAPAWEDEASGADPSAAIAPESVDEDPFAAIDPDSFSDEPAPAAPPAAAAKAPPAAAKAPAPAAKAPSKPAPAAKIAPAPASPPPSAAKRAAAPKPQPTPEPKPAPGVVPRPAPAPKPAPAPEPRPAPGVVPKPAPAPKAAPAAPPKAPPSKPAAAPAPAKSAASPAKPPPEKSIPSGVSPQAFSAPPPMPPPSRRPAAPPLPPPTIAKGAAPATAQPVLVEDVVPEVPKGAKKGRIIGIDLGTTNSAAAVVKEGKPFIIPSREGYNTIPSVVALNEKGNIIVGHPARGQLLINPKSTVYGFKRLVGRQFNSPVVTDLVGRFSYEIAPGLRGEASVKLADKIYSLQKISSLVLGEVKELAERWLGEPVTRAVITVPAYYNDNQRQAVRAAGALAGLEVERIVNEPTAAAIAFAHGRTMEQRVMVYDLGGGTFDTSVLQLQGSVYEVLSTGGDTFLGGVDFDKELVNELLLRFTKRHGVDFAGDRVAYQRINDAAERAKISLSERLTTQVKVPFVCMIDDKPYDVDETVTRAELDKLCSDLVDRSLRVCDEVLNNCGLKPADIGEVLLVGGMSRMPLVRNKIRAYFSKEPSKAVHPDEAVALGAALLADSMQSGEIGGMVLMDVLPMSIGVGLPGGRFKKIVERNTSLPHRKVHSVWTSQDQQRMLEIPIFQGESSKAQDNEYLGTLVVADIPPGTKGNVVFDVIFDISPESILKVTAEERGTARSVTATFSTQDTPDAVRKRLSSPTVARSDGDPEPLEQESKGKGLFGWLKKRKAE